MKKKSNKGISARMGLCQPLASKEHDMSRHKVGKHSSSKMKKY